MEDYDVLLVSNRDQVLEGIRQNLQSRPDYTHRTVCKALNIEEAIEAVDDVVSKGGRVGIVITDIRMPQDPEDRQGVDLLEYMVAYHPSIPVVGMSLDGPNRASADFLSKGAEAYYPKYAPVKDLLDIVDRALSRSAQA